jgi:hypothetical protein
MKREDAMELDGGDLGWGRVRVQYGHGGGGGGGGEEVGRGEGEKKEREEVEGERRKGGRESTERGAAGSEAVTR